MFKEIFLFEIRYRLNRPATWSYFGILLLFGLIMAIGGKGPNSEKVFVNSPIAIATIISTFSILGIMLASAIMGVPVYREIEHKTEHYFFSYPITEKGYLLGRFFGSMTILLMVSVGLQLGLMIGFMIGPYAGYEEVERFTSFHLWYYLQPTFTLYWTNLFFAGCIFFSLVSLTKRVMLAYAGGAILFIMYIITIALTKDIEKQNLASLLDPFGLGTYLNIIRYWTPEEQNSMTVPFQGMLIWNRLIWVGLGVSTLLFALFRFDFINFLKKNYTPKKKNANLDEANVTAAFSKIPKVSKVFSRILGVRLLIDLAFMEFKNIIKDNFFIAILMAAVLALFFDAWLGNPLYGTPSLPTTYNMLEIKNDTYTILIFVLIVFITGEVLHRERNVNYDQIFGALPLSNRLVYGAKFLSIVLVSFVLVNIIMFNGVLIQIMKGYFNFKFDMYLTDLYLIEFPKYIIFVLLAFFCAFISSQKVYGTRCCYCDLGIHFWIESICHYRQQFILV
jgi:ABC-2 type transport system permease protein